MKKPRKFRTNFPVWFAVCCALILGFGYMAQFHWLPKGWPLDDRFVAANTTTEIASVTPVVISEVMSSNKTAWPGELGLYSDWVELHNTADHDIDITGWMLTDNANRKIKFSFDRQVLSPDEYIIVYLTGNLQSAPGEPYEAPFKLSATGDALMLYDADGFIMQSLNIPALFANTSYALEGASDDYCATTLFTPGMSNTRSSHAALIREGSDETLVINEVMAVNQSTLKDRYGNYSDWVEILNTGSEEVDLTGYGLSDNPEVLLKWRFPAVTLKPGSCILVFLSGSSSIDGELHAGFRLSAEGECVCLAAPSGSLIQRLDYDVLKADEALSRDASGVYSVRAATPGRPNET